jgi:hypothetical protein
MPKASVFLGGFVGFAAATILCFLALLMTGAGHGWMSPCVPSLVALVGFPLLGAAAGMRASDTRMLIALTFLIAAFSGDLWLIAATASEGVEYFHRAMTAIPEILTSWLIIWCSSQVVSAGICISTLLGRRRPSD